MWTTAAYGPVLFEHEGGALYWYAPTEAKSVILYMRNATHGFTYKDAVAPLESGAECEHWVNASGSVLLWHHFHHNNYAHLMHDHAPSLVALLDMLGSSISAVAFPYSELAEAWLRWFDPAVLERVIFYPTGKVICFTGPTVTPLSEQKAPWRWRTPATTSLLNEKARKRHYTASADPPRPTLVFASRNSSTVKHGRALVNEREVLDSVRRMMQAYNRSEELVIYTGENVSYADQFALFSSASVIMGPHGSAMSNMLWSRGNRGCSDPVHVIEFVGSRISGLQVQGEYHGYYDLEASVPWVSYHMVTFQDNSTKARTSVSTRDVESVLSYIWGGRDTGDTTCYAAFHRGGVSKMPTTTTTTTTSSSSSSSRGSSSRGSSSRGSRSGGGGGGAGGGSGSGDSSPQYF